MIDADRPQADAEPAEIQSEMAKSRLLYAWASRDALIKRWNTAQDRRRTSRQLADQQEKRRSSGG